MITISAAEALRENKFAIVTKSTPRHVYDLYSSEDEATRICADLNKHYDDSYDVAIVDIFNEKSNV